MKGKLVIGGGNLKQSWRQIYGKFVEMLPVKKVAVVTKASEYPIESFNIVYDYLIQLGLESEDIISLPLSTYEANKLDMGICFSEEEAIKTIENVGGIWFCGGDQSKITSELLTEDNEDSNILLEMKNLLEKGGIIGGTSAGAAIMSRFMITSGTDYGALNYGICEYEKLSEDIDSDYYDYITYSKGLGFIPDCIIDQHFNKRPRLQRLMVTMRHTGEKIGYGISEDTAMIVDLETKRINVLGSAYVLKIELSYNEANLKYLYK